MTGTVITAILLYLFSSWKIIAALDSDLKQSTTANSTSTQPTRKSVRTVAKNGKTTLKPTKMSYRVVKGYDCSVKDNPFFVSLNDNGVHFCGGTIYNLTHILTAAHCCAKEGNITIQAGRFSLKTPSDQERRVIKKTNHPDYKKKTVEYDLCVMELDQPLVETETIKIVEIGSGQGVLKTWDGYQGAKVMGFGYNKEVTLNSADFAIAIHAKKTLQCANVNVLSIENCTKVMGHLFVPTSMMCVVSPTGGSICFGDSGGPLMAGKIQIGVASFIPTRRCEYPHAMFAKVDYNSLSFLSQMRSGFEKNTISIVLICINFAIKAI